MALPDKWLALKEFWSSFKIPAYEENSVPDSAEMPYITYEARTANFENEIQMQGQIWYFSRSWEDISKKAGEIATAIGYGRKIIPIEGGYLSIRQGSPFAQRLSELGSDMVRRIIISVNCEFFTAE